MRGGREPPRVAGARWTVRGGGRCGGSALMMALCFAACGAAADGPARADAAAVRHPPDESLHLYVPRFAHDRSGATCLELRFPTEGCRPGVVYRVLAAFVRRADATRVLLERTFRRSELEGQNTLLLRYLLRELPRLRMRTRNTLGHTSPLSAVYCADCPPICRQARTSSRSRCSTRLLVC